VNYIKQVRSLIAGTALSGVPVGHVDTWTAWVNGTNNAVIDACDFVGMDAYPYFQGTMSNGIEAGSNLFDEALAATQSAVGNKNVWITETGWPVTGKTVNLGVPSIANAKTFWDQVGCPRFGKVNMFWYTLEDTDNNATPDPSFGITSGTSTTPLFDLSCSGVSSSKSSSAASTATSAASRSSATGGSGAATTLTGSSIASAASSLSTAATAGNVVSSGGALSPSKGPGSGYGSGSNTTATATGASGSSNATGLATSLKPTGTSSGGSSTSTNVSTGAGSVLSGSVVGALGAVFAVLATL